MARLFDQVLPVSQITLQPAPVFPELYREVWMYSGSYSSTTVAYGSAWLVKGSTSPASSVGSAHQFTLGNWPAGTQFALEATIWTSNASAHVNVGLYDVTASTNIATISTSSTTAMGVRSSNFTANTNHTFAIDFGYASSSATSYVTDVNIIIFPSSPLTSPSVSAISLASGNALKEAYIPLWVYSSGTFTSASGGMYLVQKGTSSGSVVLGSQTSANYLFTPSSNWSANQKFALEASIYNSSTSNNCILELWDFNTSASVASVITSSTTATLLRSGQFTVTAGHKYGLRLYNTSTTSAYLTKCHIIALAN